MAKQHFEISNKWQSKFSSQSVYSELNKKAPVFFIIVWSANRCPHCRKPRPAKPKTMAQLGGKPMCGKKQWE